LWSAFGSIAKKAVFATFAFFTLGIMLTSQTIATTRAVSGVIIAKAIVFG
jgi:hypothetical protein